MKQFHITNNITSVNKIHNLLGLLFLFQTLFIFSSFADEQIGMIMDIKGNAYVKNITGKEIELNIYDQIFKNDIVSTDEASTTTIQYIDNTTIFLKKSSSIEINELNPSGSNIIFLGKIAKGSAIIESGKIAKIENGKMIIALPKFSLSIKGTRLNVNALPNGESDVSLAEDIFGNVGTINVSSEGQLKTLFETDQVLSLDNTNNFSARASTEIEVNEINDSTEIFVSASKIDENIIQKNLEKQLIDGSLKDVNNDGKIDSLDIETFKDVIKTDKQDKINFITNNSTTDNSNFLSLVLDASDEASIGKTINNILDNNDDLIPLLVSNLSDSENSFITTSANEQNNTIKEKIYSQLLSNTDNEEFSLGLISKIISKSDTDTVSIIIDNIQLRSQTDTNSNTSLKILSNVTNFQSDESLIFEDNKQSQVNRLIQEAIDKANDSGEDSQLIANIISKSDSTIVGTIVEQIRIADVGNINSNMSLNVLSSIASIRAEESIVLGIEEQTEVNKLIEEAINRAEQSNEDATLIANVIAKSDLSVISEMVDGIKLNEKENINYNMSLIVLSSIVDIQSDQSISLDTSEQSEVNRLIEEAVARATGSEGDSSLLANVIAKSSVSSIEEIVDNIQQNEENNLDSNISLQVLTQIVDIQNEESITLASDEQTQVNRLIKDALDQALESKGNDDAAVNNLLKEITEKNSNSGTANEIIEYIVNSSDSETYTGATTATTDNNSTTDSVADTGNTAAGNDTPTYDGDSTDAENDGTATENDGTATENDGTGLGNDGEGIGTGAGFTPPETSDDDESPTYDSGGFSTVTPFYHKDTDTAYNNAGFDKDGNTDPGEGGEGDEGGSPTFDSNGFSTVTPFYHKDTDTDRDNEGYNKDGYNVNGFNRLGVWNSVYDDIDNVSSN